MKNYEEIMKDMLIDDERFVIMTAENRAAIRGLEDWMAERGDGRFIDTGITEKTMIGMAAGLALCGRIPITHALATFLTMRAFEFVRTDVGIGNLPVKLVGCVPGFLSDGNGPTHQAIEDVSIMRGIPNMGVFCPADEEDMLLGLETVCRSAKPFYIRYNTLPAVVKHDTNFEIGKGEQFGDGTDVAILVYGILFNQAYEAKQLLEKQGLSVRVINLRTVAPIDEVLILKAIEETDLVVTLEDHFLTGGLFSILSELMVRHQKMTRVLPIALDNRWFKPALLPDVLEYEGFTGPQIADKIAAHIDFNPTPEAASVA